MSEGELVVIISILGLILWAIVSVIDAIDRRTRLNPKFCTKCGCPIKDFFAFTKDVFSAQKGTGTRWYRKWKMCSSLSSINSLDKDGHTCFFTDDWQSSLIKSQCK